jgi:ABC-2 type transport system ATP-binding protein
MDEVAQLCDRVIFLHRGRIASSGRPEDLAASAAATRVRFRVTHGLPRLLELADADGLPRSLDDGVVEVEIDEARLADFLAALAADGVRYREIAMRKPTLEDYFLKLAAGAAGARPGPPTTADNGAPEEGRP